MGKNSLHAKPGRFGAVRFVLALATGNCWCVGAYFGGLLMRKNLTVTWLCCIVLLLWGAPVVAQTITASIRGTVTDPSGAVVSGADVTATNVATNVATHTTSNNSGLYNFQFLTLGDYTVTATATGFNSTSVGPFHLQIDQIAQINPKLSVGTASTTVNVAANAGAILNTTNASLGTS